MLDGPYVPACAVASRATSSSTCCTTFRLCQLSFALVDVKTQWIDVVSMSPMPAKVTWRACAVPSCQWKMSCQPLLGAFWRGEVQAVEASV